MTSFRALIFAVLVALASVAGYIVWANLQHAPVKSKELVIVGSANKPDPHAKKQLHVSGCVDDFTVAVGELVEPRVVPGSTLDQFRVLYGKETKLTRDGIATWVTDPYTLTEESIFPSKTSALKPQGYVSLTVNQGHVVQTLDGIELGIDTFAALFRKLRDRKIEGHESLERLDGNWVYTASFYSSCGRKYRGEYIRILPESPEINAKIIAQVPVPNGPANQTPSSSTNVNAATQWKSDVFMSKVISDYRLVVSNGRDSSDKGQLVSHE